MNQPGSLTPIGYSPLPYTTNQRTSTFPMVPMSETPKQVPTIDEINSLAQEIANLFSKTPSMMPNYGLPSIPNQSNLRLPSVPNLPSYPTVQLPSIPNYGLPPALSYGVPSVANKLPSIPNYGLPPALSYGLPSVANKLPTLPSIANQPSYLSNKLPSVQVPLVSNYQFATMPFIDIKSNLLADNEIGDLRWNRPNPPVPLKITSSYRRVGCIGDGSCLFHAIAKALSENYQMSYKKFNTISEAMLRQFESSVNNAITFPSDLFTTPRVDRTSTIDIVYIFSPYSNFDNLMTQYRRLYVKMLRADFANQILNDIRMQSIVRKRLPGSIELNAEILMVEAAERGQILSPEQAQIQGFQNVLRGLAQDLLSDGWLQPDFLVLLSEQVGVDIYLIQNDHLINSSLPDSTTPLYSRVLHDTVYGPSDMRDVNDIYSREPNRTAIVIIAVDNIHYEIVARVDEGEEMNRDIQPKMTSEEPLIRRLYEMLKAVRYII